MLMRLFHAILVIKPFIGVFFQCQSLSLSLQFLFLLLPVKLILEFSMVH